MNIHQTTFECPFCKKYSSLRQSDIKHGDTRREFISRGVNIENDGYWWIGLCNSCEHPFLILDEGVEIYPQVLPSITDIRIPDNIRENLIEAKKCYSVSAYRGCATLARRIIQIISLEKGANPNDKLVDQIKWLRDSHIITNEIKEWADVVRWVGNEAAHPSQSGVVTQVDAKDILDLTEQITNILYIAPAISSAKKQALGK